MILKLKNSFKHIQTIALVALLLSSILLRAQVPGTPYLLPEATNRILFDFEYSSCTNSRAPNGWSNYTLTPDCSGSRNAIMNPQDSDDEVIMFGEAIKRDISSLGLTAGTQITLNMDAVAANIGGTTYSGSKTFVVKVYSANPGTNNTYGFACSGGGGQLVLTGTNATLNIQNFSNTVTLTQDANWIVVSNCDTGGFGGNVVDDLEISW